MTPDDRRAVFRATGRVALVVCFAALVLSLGNAALSWLLS